MKLFIGLGINGEYHEGIYTFTSDKCSKDIKEEKKEKEYYLSIDNDTAKDEVFFFSQSRNTMISLPDYVIG